MLISYILGKQKYTHKGLEHMGMLKKPLIKSQLKTTITVQINREKKIYLQVYTLSMSHP
jgi:hypothetical protein